MLFRRQLTHESGFSGVWLCGEVKPDLGFPRDGCIGQAGSLKCVHLVSSAKLEGLGFS